MTWRCQTHKKDALPRNKSYQGGWSCCAGPHRGSGATSSTNTQRNPLLFFFSSKLFYMITEMPLAPHESDGQKTNEEESEITHSPPNFESTSPIALFPSRLSFPLKCMRTFSYKSEVYVVLLFPLRVSQQSFYPINFSSVLNLIQNCVPATYTCQALDQALGIHDSTQ